MVGRTRSTPIPVTRDAPYGLHPGAQGYRGPLPPARFNLARYCVGASAATYPDKAALLVFDNPDATQPAETWTFLQLETAILNTATALKARGLKTGDRVLIRLGNTSSYAIAFLGANAAGLVPIPASAQLTAEEAGFLAEDSAAAAVIIGDGLDVCEISSRPKHFDDADVAAMIDFPVTGTYAPTLAGDPAFLIYTSGTTAHPKGVLHAQRAAWGRRPMFDGWYGLTNTDHMLHAGAFNWTFTLGTGLMDPWSAGATAIVYTGEKTPQVWPRLIAASKATLFAAVPGVFRQILKYAPPSREQLATLRHGLIAGETPPPSLFSDWEKQTGTALYEALGMSEISTYISCGPGTPRRENFVGKAQPGRAIAILPEMVDPTTDEETAAAPLPANSPGLLAVHRSDPGLMLGYWNRPAEEAKVFRGDWFVGGDRGLIDLDGYVQHLGRANDVMKVLGYRVSPQEVEAVLIRHPAIAEVACTSLEVREGVTIIAAFVVPREEVSGPDTDALRAFAAEHLAEYKRPREYRFVSALPRTVNGKIRRAGLRLS